MSRAKARVGIARKYNNDVDVLTSMKPVHYVRGKVMKAGWVICDDKDLVWEEAPEVYKSVEFVADELKDCGVAAVVGRCIPRVTYKVRKE